MSQPSLDHREFRMPAEWEEHEGTWLQWPHEDSHRGHQFKLERTWLDMLTTLQKHETVHVLVKDERRREHFERQLEHYAISGDNVDPHVIPNDDVWARDNGPIFVVNDKGQLAITHWIFNGWGGRFEHQEDARVPSRIGEALSLSVFKAPLITEGGAIEVNGQGTLMATRSSIINPNRSPEKSQEEIEELLKIYLGVKHFIWLSGAPPEACESWGDSTDFHIDIAARFVNETTVLYQWTDDQNDPRYPYFKKHLEELRAATTESGKSLTLVPLPSPRNGVLRISQDPRWYGSNVLTDAAYMNYYVANGVVLVPVFGNADDQKGKEIIGEMFPGREVVGIDAVSLTEEGGAMHCVTQQQPRV